MCIHICTDKRRSEAQPCAACVHTPTRWETRDPMHTRADLSLESRVPKLLVSHVHPRARVGCNAARMQMHAAGGRTHFVVSSPWSLHEHGRACHALRMRRGTRGHAAATRGSRIARADPRPLRASMSGGVLHKGAPLSSFAMCSVRLSETIFVSMVRCRASQDAGAGENALCY